MKQGRTEKAVFAKLSKVELSSSSSLESQSAKLANLMNKAVKTADKLMSAKQQYQKLEADADTVLDKLQSQINDAKSEMSKFEAKVKELGMQPTDSNAYNDIERIINGTQFAIENIQIAKNL